MHKPNKEDMKGLSSIRQTLFTSCYYIAVNNETVGFATPEFFKETYNKMVTKSLTESEWFAMECQSGAIFDKCEKMYENGIPLHGK
jgi:hypothetical protein